MKWYAGLETVIKVEYITGVPSEGFRALRSFGLGNIFACVGFHSACLKLARCRWCESEGWRWRGSSAEGRKKGAREESASMGGCSFHWALPCAQVPV